MGWKKGNRIFTGRAAPVAGFLLVLALTGAVGRSVPIPGIDPIPGAVDPDTGAGAGPTSPEGKVSSPPKDTKEPTPAGGTTVPQPGKPGTTVESPKKEEKPTGPLITSLLVEKDSELPRSARLSWKVAPENDTAIYVVRYARPVSTPDRLFSATNITSPPLGPQVTTFVDRNIPDGTYYYAAVTSFEASDDKNLHLEANSNYTTSPFVVFNDEQKAPAGKPGEEGGTATSPALNDLVASEDVYSVTDIVAVDSVHSVKINWTAAKAANVEYRVYRGTVPFDRTDAYRDAVQLGGAGADLTRFEDPSPPEGKEVYYGVTVVDLSSGREFRNLKYKVSYINHSYTPEKEDSKKSDLLPGGLTAALSGKSAVSLYWEDSKEKIRGYNLYRLDRPIYGTLPLEQSKALGFIPTGEGRYEDQNMAPGQYFYALLPVNQKGEELREFVEGRTFTGFSVHILPEKNADTVDENDYRVDGLLAVDTPDSVILNWQPAKADGIRYTVYRIPAKKDASGRTRPALKLGYASQEKPSFQDRSAPPGEEVYYVVTVTEKSTGKEHRKLEFNHSFIRHAFHVPSTTDGDSDLLPGSLVAYQFTRDGVKLFWVDPPKGAKSLSVYRSALPISGEESLGKATRLSSVEPGRASYVDEHLNPGQYYYALIPVTENGEELHRFVEGRTFTGFAINVSDRSTENEPKPGEEKRPVQEAVAGEKPPERKREQDRPEIRYLAAAPDEKGIRIVWDVEKNLPEKVRFLLYRSRLPVKTVRELRRSGVLVDELPGESRSFIDAKATSGSYYYALLIEVDGTVRTTLEPGRNYLVEPVRALEGQAQSQPEAPASGAGESESTEQPPPEEKRESPEFQKEMDAVNLAIATTYLKREYGETIRKLSLLVNDRGVPEEARARARFYMGLAYYNLHQYDDAIVQFQSGDVQRYFPERAGFWLHRSLEAASRLQREKMSEP